LPDYKQDNIWVGVLVGIVAGLPINSYTIPQIDGVGIRTLPDWVINLINFSPFLVLFSNYSALLLAVYKFTSFKFLELNKGDYLITNRDMPLWIVSGFIFSYDSYYCLAPSTSSNYGCAYDFVTMVGEGVLIGAVLVVGLKAVYLTFFN